MAKSIMLVGLGVTGQSIGLALRQSGVEAERIGYDPDGKQADQAKRLGAIDRTEGRLASASSSPLVIVSVAPSAQVSTLKALAPSLPPDAVVLDASPLKQPALEALADLRRAGSHYVGLLPAVGGDRLTEGEASHQEASPDHFRGGVLGLIIPPETPQEALELALQLAAILGATPYFLEAGEADSAAAVTHILPPLLSTALMQVALHETAWREVRRTAGSEFAAMVDQGLQLPPRELAATALLARTSVLEKLDHLLEAIQALRSTIERNDNEALAEVIAQSDRSLHAWLSTRRQANWALDEIGPAVSMPSQSVFGRLFGFRRPGGPK